MDSLWPLESVVLRCSAIVFLVFLFVVSDFLDMLFLCCLFAVSPKDDAWCYYGCLLVALYELACVLNDLFMLAFVWDEVLVFGMLLIDSLSVICFCAACSFCGYLACVVLCMMWHRWWWWWLLDGVPSVFL